MTLSLALTYLLWGVLGFIACNVIFSPLIFRVLYMHHVARVLEEVPWLQAKTFPAEPQAEPCEFRTADGMTLKGSYLRHQAEQRTGVLLFCHEMTGDRWLAVPYTVELRKAGFDVLTFDFRNHGESQSVPQYEPIPWLSQFELHDIQAAVDYAVARPDADPRGLGIIGISRGGAAALCAAATRPAVRAVATDGAFPTVPMMLYYLMRFMSIYTIMAPVYRRIPRVYLSFLMWWTLRQAEPRRHCRFVKVEDYFRRVRQPCLLIHGELDSHIPPSIMQDVHGMLRGPVECWLAPKARHNQAMWQNETEYHRRLVAFFLRHFSPSAT